MHETRFSLAAQSHACKTSRWTAQTSSALTRLTVKLAEPDSRRPWGLRAPVWCREKSDGVLDRWVRRTVCCRVQREGLSHRSFAHHSLRLLAKDIAQSLPRSSSLQGDDASGQLICHCFLLLMMLDCILFLQRMKSRGRKGQFPNGANEIKGPARCSHSQLYLRWGVQS